MKIFTCSIVFVLIHFCSFAQPFSKAEIARWQQQAKQVNIIRDNWGIPHVYGQTDADAVFGLMYAQCEDDFKRVERNYIEKLGRLAEVDGENELYNDLYIRLIIDSAEAKADYDAAPAWLKELLHAFADGINYYLYKNPTVKPRLLYRFEPWYPLLWTDGSIGAISTGDIDEIEVKQFYTGKDAPVAQKKRDEDFSTGSNGFAVAPSKTVNGNAILYINPHVTFYFRPEVHMVSKQGLNVYGAVTWGQFFVYQGFNEHCGWMHTSSNVDVSDMYEEKIVKTDSGLVYKYNYAFKKVKEKKIKLAVSNTNGTTQKEFAAWYTHHGPVMSRRNDKYISVKSFNRSIISLTQSWLRTKAKGFDDYKQTMEMRGNTSNNTVFADNKGNIAYWHGNYVPKRDETYNWGKPVDGTITNTEWKGLHTLDEIVHVYNPPTGFIQNCNSTPFTVAGGSSPQRHQYFPYLAPDGENFRGINAARLLQGNSAFTIDKMIAVGYNRQLAAFELLVPALTQAFDATCKPGDSLFTALADAIAILKQWDFAMDENSVATTVAIEWAEHLPVGLRKIYIEEGETSQVENVAQFAKTTPPLVLLQTLQQTLADLTAKNGTWKITWGTINRYQRISSDIQQQYQDSAPSAPIAFASALWGSLPAYVSRYYPGTQKRYGVSGNSFVCAVEFGPRITARSLLAGGNSGNPQSPHFNDQLTMYTQGNFKDVLFYKEDVLQHAERSYHPGE
jgi:acyl-homoserine lactone acylase PvdQ